MGKYKPHDNKIIKMAKIYKKYQMAINYNKFFHSLTVKEINIVRYEKYHLATLHLTCM
jgi:hypothetical protein